MTTPGLLRIGLLLCATLACVAPAPKPAAPGLKPAAPSSTVAPAAVVLAPSGAPAPVPEPLAPPPDAPAPMLRLPAHTKPLRYTLELTVDPAEPRFFGQGTIEVELAEPRRVLWLHGQGLSVSKVTARFADASLEGTYTQVAPEGVAKLVFPRPLGPGRVALSFAWDAPFDQQLAGVYLARSGGVPGAYTQFESIDARKAMPCFDDPVYKTPFALSLVVRAEHVAVANTVELSSTPLPQGHKRVVFAPTEPLPTYLLAFAAGDFDVVTPPPLPPNEVRARPLQLRGIAPKGRGAELAFALEVAAAELVLLERWFGLPYPYDKLDHVAVPDFTHGAMENAGLITYREAALLHLPGRDAPGAQRRIVGIIAHETAHQWFGDLVTLRWWTDTWLNEAFATWLGTKIAEAWGPQHRPALGQLGGVHSAMEEDSLTSALAIRQEVTSVGLIDNLFSGITYQKGAGVLSMFERWVGKETFRAGVHDYLVAHTHGGGSTDDLLAAISKAAGKDVTTPFRTFIDQAGVPLVEVGLQCRGDRAWLQLAQSRALPVGAQATEAMKAQRWQVPVCARYGKGQEAREACTLLTGNEGTLELQGGCPAWVMPNADASGYFRWSLSPPALRGLTSNLKALNVRERLSLAASLSGAFHAATLPAKDVLLSLEPLSRDDDGAVAAAAMGPLGLLDRELLPEAAREKLAAIARELYRPAARRLGWEPKAGEAARLGRQRAQTLSVLASTGRDPVVLAEAARRGRAYANLAGTSFDTRAITPELSGLALWAAVKLGDDAFYEGLLSRLWRLDDAASRVRVLAALRARREPKRLAQTLALSLEPRLRTNERLELVTGFLGAPETRAQAVAFARAHFDELLPLLSERRWTDLVAALASEPCEAGALEEAQAFLAPRVARLPATQQDYAGALEEARLCIALKAAQGASALDYVQSRGRLPATR